MHEVTCKTDTLHHTGATALDGGYFGSGFGPYQLDDVDCDGGQYSLLACDTATVGIHNCGTGQSAGVMCDGT